MRVGFICYGLDRNATGIGRYTLAIANAVEHQGVDVQRLWAGSAPPDRGVEIMRGSYYLPGLLTLGQVQVARLATRLNLDILHDPTGVMPLVLVRTPSIVTIHDAVPHVHPQSSTHLDKLVYRRWLPHMAKRIEAIITDSRQSKEDLAQNLKLNSERITVVPLAAGEQFRLLPPDEVGPVLGHYNITQPYILYVGALESRKNLPRLLQAYALLRQEISGTNLVIVGARKWKYTPIFNTVKELQLEPNVLFTGYVPDDHLPALYSGATLFVFPSLYEGFGLPVLEAMACGTPVVTSNTSSLPEVAGNAALLVDPYDVREIATAMRRVLLDPALAGELRVKGLKQAATFTWERTAKETISVYENVLATRKD